jgi:hypothetical protein
LLGFGLKNISLAIFTFVIPILGVSIFQKKIRNVFSKTVLIEESGNCLSVRLYQINSDILEDQYQLRFTEINSFSISPSGRGSACVIKLFLKDAKKKEFSFWGEGTVEHNLPYFFIDIFKDYNSSAPKDVITMKPNLMGTKVGFGIIVLLSLLLILDIAVHIVHNFKGEPISLIIGIILYLMLLVQRSGDIKSVKKFNEQQSRS